MGLAYDQQTVQARSGGVNSLQQTVAQAVDAGDLVVACISTYFSTGTGGTWTVTDDASQTYTEAIDNSGDAQSWIGLFYKENHPGGTIKITVNPNGSSADIDFTISEVSGAVASGSLDKTATNTGESTAPSVASGVLAQANEIIFAIVSNVTSTTAVTPDATYTQIGENEDNGTGQSYNAQYKIVSSTASDTADWTMGVSVFWFACLASFKEAAVGGHPALRRHGGIQHGPRVLGASGIRIH